MARRALPTLPAALAKRLKSAVGTEHRHERDFTVRAGAEPRTLEFVASTEGVASDGMIVLASAWDVARFLAAGAFLWAHNRWEDKPPIGVPVSARIDDANKQLVVVIRFAKAEDYAFADTCYRLFLDGILRACSVGFRVLEMREPIPVEKEKGAWGVVTKAELFELSAVPVPADAGALVQGVRSGKLTAADREPLELMARSVGKTEGEASWREALRALAGDAPMKRTYRIEGGVLQARDGDGPWRNAGLADVEPRAGVKENCEFLRDFARILRQQGDALEATANDLEANAGTGEHEGVSDAEAKRQALETENAALKKRLGELESAAAVKNLCDATRAAIKG